MIIQLQLDRQLNTLIHQCRRVLCNDVHNNVNHKTNMDITVIRSYIIKCIIYLYAILQPRAYLRGGGGGRSGDSNPFLKFSNFFLKSAGKEVERKINKKRGGGGVNC